MQVRVLPGAPSSCLWKQVAINLFYGWGYNFYRKENQLRQDDQLVRAKAALLLAQAQSSAEAAEHAYRREKLPSPTRADPYPDPAAVAEAQALERLSRRICDLIGRLHALPAPENDRMTQRYRREAETLQKLGACDEQLIGQCELLRSLLEGASPAAMLEQATALTSGLAAIEETLRERESILA